MRLHFVRHGQSAWNVERRLQGQTPGIPLTELGREQARAAARRLVGMATVVWASDLLRARQTADELVALLGCELRLDERLREQHYGVLEGRLTSELRTEPTPEGIDVTEVCWGGGESLEQVYVRIRSFLLALPEADAIIVTHGDTLRVALTVVDQLNRGELEDRPWRRVAWPIVENGSLTIVDYERSPDFRNARETGVSKGSDGER